jgi:hypothetical protein
VFGARGSGFEGQGKKIWVKKEKNWVLFVLGFGFEVRILWFWGYTVEFRV